MSFEEIDTEDSASSLSEVSSLNDDFDTMHLESGSSDGEVTDDDMDSNAWNEIEPEFDAEFLEDHGLIEEVTSASEDNIGLSTKFCRFFLKSCRITKKVLEVSILRVYI